MKLRMAICEGQTCSAVVIGCREIDDISALGIGQHNLAEFRTLFLNARDRLRASVMKSRGYSVPENAVFPVYWGDWGPVAWYEGMELQPGPPLISPSQSNSIDLATAIQAKSLRVAASSSLDIGLDYGITTHTDLGLVHTFSLKILY